MEDAVRNEFLTAYYGSLTSYERVAAEVRRLFDLELDPSVPATAIYTINHRVKGEQRFLEKIEEATKENEVTRENFGEYVRDMLGIRIVCLRLSDVEKIEEFIASLRDEDKLRFVEGPNRKKTFVLRVDPREDQSDEDLDLQYSGYSSTHYLVTLGGAGGIPQQLANLRAEVQVRTILEEAWGEIDHKYRYELVRAGGMVPEHVQQGFYSFAAYLQAAALQAEYLCAEAERSATTTELGVPATELGVPATRKQLEETDTPLDESHPASNALLRELVVRLLSFAPSRRTLNYLVKRLYQNGVTAANVDQIERDILSPDVLRAFGEIYAQIYTDVRGPFSDPFRRDVDLINTVNFALTRMNRGEAVAESGLRSVLERRLATEESYEVIIDGETRGTFRFGQSVTVGERIWIHGVVCEVMEKRSSAGAPDTLFCVAVPMEPPTDGSPPRS